MIENLLQTNGRFLFELIFFKTNIKNEQQASFSAECRLVLKIWSRNFESYHNFTKKKIIITKKNLKLNLVKETLSRRPTIKIIILDWRSNTYCSIQLMTQCSFLYICFASLKFFFKIFCQRFYNATFGPC